MPRSAAFVLVGQTARLKVSGFRAKIMEIILASASPRRRELLSRIFTDFEVIPAVGREEADTALSPEDYVLSLASHKCGEVFAAHPEALVIGCDTVVVFGDKILGKPADKDDAVNTLKTLSGKTHRVMTGVCVRSPYKSLSRVEITEVRFNVLSDKFIKEYVEGGSPMDKAGSYGIQDGGIVRSYVGSYTNVVGLPVGTVKNMVMEALAIG